MMRTKIKICGLTRPEEVNYVNLFNPDYVGFVLAGGRHHVTPKQAAAMRAGLNRRIRTVGVFVNEKIDIICGLLYDGVIDMVQLHGDEDADYIWSLREKIQDMYYDERAKAHKLVKAVRVRDEGSLRQARCYPVDYLLFDSYSENVYGGSGRSFDRRLLKKAVPDKPYFLAGGLNPGNIRDAISECEPYCVDISSGVETGGVKDLEKIKEVMRAVRGG